MKKVLVIGDIILDKYVYVTTERQCPEADKPVWDTEKVEFRLGGAANAANNLDSLGDDVTVHLAGMADLYMYEQICDTTNIQPENLMISDGRQITKTRIVQNNGKSLREALVARIDDRKMLGRVDEKRFENYALNINRDDYDAIVISDYRMGTISDKTARYLCQNSPCRVYVDSKRKDLSVFRGAYALKLNEQEHSLQVSNKDYVVESLCNFIIVTRGAAGARVSYYEPVRGKLERPTYITHAIDFPTENVDVVDVTGCGDTFTAAIAYYMTTKLDDIYTATKFANICASKVVQKFGTSI